MSRAAALLRSRWSMFFVLALTVGGCQLAENLAGGLAERFFSTPERSGKLRDTIKCRCEFFRIRPYAIDRRADRERLAGAICNGAAVRRDFFRAQVARIGLLVQKVLIEHLQVNSARDERRGK